MTALGVPGDLGRPNFRTGRAISRTFSVLRRQAIPYSLLCIASFVPPCVLLLVAPALPLGPHTVIHVGAQDFHVYAGRILMLPLFFGSFSLVPLGAAIILLVTMQELEGKRPSLDAVARHAGARFLPLLACTACGWLAVAGGCLLLIVPGVIAALVFSVAGQVCVAERLGPIESLARSAALTKGNRSRILAFYLVVAGIFVAITTAEGLAEASLGIVGALAGICLTGFSEAFWATACAVQYIDLRISQEGIGTERIAAVFD
jgi:hypothetical protein